MLGKYCSELVVVSMLLTGLDKLSIDRLICCGETSSNSFLRAALASCACWCRESREGGVVLVLDLP